MKRLLFFITFFASLVHAQTPTSLLPVPLQQFLSSSGQPLSGGCVFTYQSGTASPLATYTDSTGSITNPNPVILDSAGFASIWLQSAGTYAISVFSYGGTNCAQGIQQWSVNGVSGPPNLPAPGPIGMTVPNVIEATRFLSSTANPALSGLIRMATTDSACWRNITNTADDCLSDPSSVLTWPGAGGLLLNGGGLQDNLNGCTPARVDVGATITQAISGCLIVPSTSNATNGNAVGGYVINRSSSPGCGIRGTCAVGGYFSAQAGANNVLLWGINPACNDTSTYGSFTGVNCQNEFDQNVTSSTTIAKGAAFTGEATVSDTNTIAADVQPGVGPFPVWWVGFQCDSGSVGSNDCLSANPINSGNNVNSQSILLAARDSSGAAENARIRSNPTGNIQVSPPAGGSYYFLNSGGGLQLPGSTRGAATIVAAASGGGNTYNLPDTVGRAATVCTSLTAAFGCTPNFGTTTTVCSTGSGPGSICKSTVPLTYTEPDSNYSAICSGSSPTGYPIIIGATPTSASSVTVEISNGTNSMAVVSTFAKLACIVAGT